MKTYKNSRGVVGNFSYDDLRPHEKEGLITAIKKGATRREVMGWMMAAGVLQLQQLALYLQAPLQH